MFMQSLVFMVENCEHQKDFKKSACFYLYYDVTYITFIHIS